MSSGSGRASRSRSRSTAPRSTSSGRALAAHGLDLWELRVAGGKDGPVITESGNLVIDAWFDQIPQGLQAS